MIILQGGPSLPIGFVQSTIGHGEKRRWGGGVEPPPPQSPVASSLYESAVLFPIVSACYVVIAELLWHCINMRIQCFTVTSPFVTTWYAKAVMLIMRQRRLIGMTFLVHQVHYSLLRCIGSIRYWVVTWTITRFFVHVTFPTVQYSTGISGQPRRAKLQVPRARTTIGRRSFAVVEPSL